MTSKTFTTGTVIDSDWLNDADNAVYKDTISITRYGASKTNTTSQNKTALQEAISAVDTAGGGCVLVPGGINYGYKRTDFTTHPDFTGCVNPILVMDYGVGNSYTAPSRDGAQVRRFFYTPNPGMSDGNGVMHRASWHPYLMLSSDNHGTRDTSDPYRASIFWEANDGVTNSIGWRLGQRDITSGSTGDTVEKQSSFGLSVEGNFIWGGTAWVSTSSTFVHGLDRYTGNWAWGTTPANYSSAYTFYIRNGQASSSLEVRGETPAQLPTISLIADGTTNRFDISPGNGNVNFRFGVAGSNIVQFDNGGHTHIGGAVPSNARHSMNGAFAEGAEILQVFSTSTTDTMDLYSVATFGANSAACAVQFGKNSVTGRSINTGGTVNASGADYAEYMCKAPDCADLAKGAICGIDANGQLTDKWANAISFAVKSTNPSYVGSDTWAESLGPRPKDDEAAQAEYDAQLEVLRQKVDRIAFAGQVPVNVLGATPGQFIIPVQDGDGIKGIAKGASDLTLTEYMRAVGKAIAIEDDGRARIIVKVP